MKSEMIQDIAERNVITILSTRIIAATGYMMLTPFLSIMLLANGVSTAKCALITAFYTFSQTGFMIPAAWILNKLHYKKSMIWGRLITAILVLGYTWSKNIIILLSISLAIGFGTSLYNLTCKGYIGIISSDNNRKRLNLFAAYNVAMNIGSSLGPLLGSLIVAKDRYMILLLVIIIMNLLSAIVTAIFMNRIEETDIRKVANTNMRVSQYLNKDFISLIIITVLLQILFTQMFSVMPVYFVQNEINIYYYTIMLTINTVGCVMLQTPVLWISKMILKERQKYGLFLAAMIYVLGYCFMYFSNENSFSFCVLGGLLTIAELVLTPYQDKLVSDLSKDPILINYYISVFGVAWAIGKGLGNYIGIKYLEYTNDTNSYWALLSIVGLTIVVLILFSNRGRGNLYAEAE